MSAEPEPAPETKGRSWAIVAGVGGVALLAVLTVVLVNCNRSIETTDSGIQGVALPEYVEPNGTPAPHLGTWIMPGTSVDDAADDLAATINPGKDRPVSTAEGDRDADSPGLAYCGELRNDYKGIDWYWTGEDGEPTLLKVSLTQQDGKDPIVMVEYLPDYAGGCTL